MRRIRGSFHLALSVAGTVLIIYAVVGIEGMYDRMLVVALGIVLIEAGIWRITQSLFPNDRNFRPLRKETDYFITLVRRLNRAAVNSQRGSASAADELVQIHSDLHHSVDRMVRLAGLTEEDLGFRYSPKKPDELTQPDADVDAAAGPEVTAQESTDAGHASARSEPEAFAEHPRRRTLHEPVAAGD